MISNIVWSNDAILESLPSSFLLQARARLHLSPGSSPQSHAIHLQIFREWLTGAMPEWIYANAALLGKCGGMRRRSGG